jgi:poly-D-alanine transfer protein DltD
MIKLANIARNLLLESIRKEDEIKSLFSENPELVSIGTEEQYSRYLDTIFPNSKIKNIVYHGTKSKFEKFNTRPDTTSGSRYANEAAFFTLDRSLADKYGKDRDGKTLFILLNILNPKIYSTGLDLSKPRNISNQVRTTLQSQGFDSVQNMRYENEIGVFEPEQIHILGSKQDIEGFKKFVQND